MAKCYRVLQNLEQGTPEWLKIRAQHITATEIAHLWAGRESFENLKAIKTGAASPIDLSHTRSIQEGKYFEPMIRAEALRRWPGILPDGATEVPTPCVERLDEPFFMASLDGLCKGGIPMEIKNSCSANVNYVDVKNNGIFNKVAKQYGYYAQVQWQLYCTGAPFAIFLTHQSKDGEKFCRENFYFSRVNRDEVLIAELVKLGLAFKAYLLNGTEPKNLVINGHVFFSTQGTDSDLGKKIESYRSINDQYELLNSQIKNLRESRSQLAKEIVEQYLPAGSKRLDGQGYHLSKTERSGSIDCEALCAALLDSGLVNEAFIEKYRKPSTVSYAIKID